MIDTLLAKVFGKKADREVKRIRPMVAAINSLEGQLQQFTDEQLRAKTQEFKERIAQGTKIDDLLVEAFAVCREAGKRTLNMRHFDVQLIGGIVLHEGKIAEMRTGEGKTLVATLPVYLNALEGKGVHVVTVNDYLAKRDSEWMGRIYNFLGLSVGVIIHGLDDQERYDAYHCDITYGTNNEYGFDYLRDNMKFRLSDCVQRGHHFAIVDEVDSILIDEARTPLIISGPSEESTDKYYRINQIIPKLVRGEVIEGKEPGEKYTTGDYTVDERTKSVALTEEGVLKVERLLACGNLYDPENIETNHHVQQALRAHVLYRRDVEYVIREGQVIIVDENTGRMMPGRRWSDGLHQAVEAKEGVKIERESQTLATVTFQNFFRMYKKLCGMTGTAETEAAEFGKTYKVDVLPIPTNKKMQRIEYEDIVYRTEEEKFRNAAKEIKQYNDRGQPVLVGTVSIEKSERISKILTKMGVKHEVLNAKNHEREAFIVAQAGRKNMVTVSTNMAGRGTDILLGGNAEFMAKEHFRKQGIDPEPLQIALAGTEDRQKWDDAMARFKAETQKDHDEVVALGGLHILGTERHESRRIDNQLRGRSGRQGDPGSARFYLSLQDDLMRVFGGERIQNLMLRLGMEEDVPIESKMITKRILAAQKAVEAQHYAARKHLLEYDDVMNKQRTAIYDLRRSLIQGGAMREKILDYTKGIVGTFMAERIPPEARPDQWELNELQGDVLNQFGVKLPVEQFSGRTRSEIEESILKQLNSRYDEKESLVGPDIMRETERIVMLNVIDGQWKDHLLSMDHLKEGIGLRGYGQKDPLVEYKKESFLLFEQMMDRVEDDTVRYLFFLQASDGPPPLHETEFDEPEGFTPNGTNGNGHGPSAAAVEPPPPPPEMIAVTNDRRKAAQQSLEDFTRSIERKKDREMDQISLVGTEGTLAQQPVLNNKKDVGRNDPCYCGSGKKFKKCHGS